MASPARVSVVSNLAYEAKHFRFSATNRRIASATLNLLLGFYAPAFLFRVGRPVVRALLDPPLLAAMGYDPAPNWLQRIVFGALRTRARLLGILPLRRKPRLLTKVDRPTYPEGYKIEELGTLR